MDAEIKRTVISNIGFKIRDTTAAQPGWREEREITGDSAQFAMLWPTQQVGKRISESRKWATM